VNAWVGRVVTVSENCRYSTSERPSDSLLPDSTAALVHVSVDSIGHVYDETLALLVFLPLSFCVVLLHVNLGDLVLASALPPSLPYPSPNAWSRSL
jgi:hypothetical protein